MHRIKYIASHVPTYVRQIPHIVKSVPTAVAKIPGNMKNLGLTSGLRYFGYLSNAVLMAGLLVGLYGRWSATNDIVLLIIAFVGLFIFSISCALAYYFSMEVIGFSLCRLWIGCLLGIVAFTSPVALSADGQETEEIKEEEALNQVTNVLLLVSLLLRAVWNVLERIFNPAGQVFVLVNYYECLEQVGLCISALLTGNQVLCISLLTVALHLITVTIRLKSYMGIAELALVIIMTSTLYFPHQLQMPVNPFALSVFVVRLCFEPLLDIYYCPLSTLERWHKLFIKPAVFRRLLVLACFCIEITFLVLNATQIPQHKEWFIVIPIFTAFGMVWLIYHLVFTVTCWQLSNKLSDCNTTYKNLAEDSRNIQRIMAAKGVRHFSLICKRLVCITLVTTIILGAIGWRTKSPASLALLFIVVPLESAVLSVLWQMGSALGGTIMGYALVAPAIPIKIGQSTTVLPTSAMQEMSTRATHILNSVQRWFSHHLIDNYGCDYSSSGLTAESVQSKLCAFFQRQTSDGPKYDTYLIYYSGHVHENGDWALAGGGTLKLETLMEWWSELSNAGSRLLLVLDSDHSHQWLRPVARIRNHHVAVQTCRLVPPDDPEEGMPKIGDFTNLWMQPSPDTDWKESSPTIRPSYSVSRRWTDFVFRRPTDDDMSQHWDANFPRVTKPLIAATNFPQLGALCCCCTVVVRCLTRKRMLWFPPMEVDTGHGFKLVRS